MIERDGRSTGQSGSTKWESISLPSDKKQVRRWKIKPVKVLWGSSITLEWQCPVLPLGQCGRISSDLGASEWQLSSSPLENLLSFYALIRRSQHYLSCICLFCTCSSFPPPLSLSFAPPVDDALIISRGSTAKDQKKKPKKPMTLVSPLNISCLSDALNVL